MKELQLCNCGRVDLCDCTKKEAKFWAKYLELVHEIQRRLRE